MGEGRLIITDLLLMGHENREECLHPSLRATPQIQQGHTCIRTWQGQCPGDAGS